MDIGELQEIVYDHESLPDWKIFQRLTLWMRYATLAPELYKEYRQAHSDKAESFVEEEADRQRESYNDAWASEGSQTSPDDMF